ncbi:peptidoglycan L-alanyl-D-glutamate endopeptidase CwlK [Thalassobacillus cyri]|uniref:Peptidoglycan L-alanyl-D-glutamate endopeptidase CwlK n=1 Tax=Thalassobacillus cyri TaxID=571932 RepID=A0A1H4H1H7_9BACI|nr:peptidoglycan-binding protein [Thalassobacillus cyri]SEB15667.1 peptidoglycan L-alanyl-D-glutamate endopeptidase CwlK [Thalassobacillus cyri]
MTVSLKTLVNRSIRNMGDVHPVVKDRAVTIIERAYRKGILAQISDGLRTHAEQQALYNKGRTAPGNIVTYAPPGFSYHNFGLAVDFFLVSNDGKRALWRVNKSWKQVATIAKDLGFEWGGDWSPFKDYPHLQLTGGLALIDLRAGKKPIFAIQTSYQPPEDDGLLEKGESGAAIKRLQEQLLDLGYKLPMYGADGDFGAETEAAVKAFQKDRGIKVDGIVGPVTRQELKEAAKPVLPDETYWVKTPPFYGNGVRAVQGTLASNKPPFYPEKGAENNGVDGYYGPKTADAVERFQSYYRLKQDGIYGSETRKKLLSLLK